MSTNFNYLKSTWPVLLVFGVIFFYFFKFMLAKLLNHKYKDIILLLSLGLLVSVVGFVGRIYWGESYGTWSMLILASVGIVWMGNGSRKKWPGFKYVISSWALSFALVSSVYVACEYFLPDTKGLYWPASFVVLFLWIFLDLVLRDYLFRKTKPDLNLFKIIFFGLIPMDFGEKKNRIKKNKK